MNFSTAPDVDRLVKAGLVSSDWDSGPNKGIASDSVVVLVVRKGNPRSIGLFKPIIRMDDASVCKPPPTCKTVAVPVKNLQAVLSARGK